MILLMKHLTISLSVKDKQMGNNPIFINDAFSLIQSDSAVYMEFQTEQILKINA